MFKSQQWKGNIFDPDVPLKDLDFFLPYFKQSQILEKSSQSNLELIEIFYYFLSIKAPQYIFSPKCLDFLTISEVSWSVLPPCP